MVSTGTRLANGDHYNHRQKWIFSALLFTSTMFGLVSLHRQARPDSAICAPPHLLLYLQDTAPIVAALAKALPDVLNASVSELNFKNVVNQLGDVMYTFPFSLPPYYIAIIRCLGVLEGVALQVILRQVSNLKAIYLRLLGTLNRYLVWRLLSGLAKLCA